MAIEQASFGTPESVLSGVRSWRKEAAMSQTTVVHDPREATGEPAEPGLIAGRPVEDRSFEAVEVSVGIAAGMNVGGPEPHSPA